VEIGVCVRKSTRSERYRRRRPMPARCVLDALQKSSPAKLAFSEKNLDTNSKIWCLLAPSRGGVLLLGETRSAVLTLGDLCLLYGPFPANAHAPPGLGLSSP